MLPRIALLFTCAGCSLASAAITTRVASSDFNHPYTAADLIGGIDGWQLVDNASSGTPWSNQDGILTGSTTAAAGGRWFWQNNSPDPWYTEIEPGDSWTAEFRVTVTGASSSNNQAGIQLWTGGAGVETLLAVSDTGATIGNLSSGGGTTLETGVDNSTAFQTYRLAFDSNSRRFFAWHGTRLLNPLGDSGYATSNQRFIVGDGQSSNTMGMAQVEYVRFDTDGAYAPLDGELPPDLASLLSVVSFGDSTTAPRNVGASLNGRPPGASTSHDGTVVDSSSPFLYVYTDVLRDELPLSGVHPDQVLNRGAGGNRTDQALARLDTDVRSNEPEVAIVQFGINDSWQDAGAGTASRVALDAAEQVGHPFASRGNFTDNLDQIVSTLQGDATRVILMTPNKQGSVHPQYRNDTLLRYVQVIRSAATNIDVELIDVWQMYEEYDAVDGQSLDDLLLDGQHPNAAGHRLVADALIGLLAIGGDLNLDGTADCHDVDELTSAIVSESELPRFDLNGDGLVNGEDLAAWLSLAAATNLGPGRSYARGDANLDGTVDVTDFNVWNSHKFTEGAGWCGGDWNADGAVDVSDFNLWNASKFTSARAVAVPEPSPFLVCWLGWVLTWSRKTPRTLSSCPSFSCPSFPGKAKHACRTGKSRTGR